MKGTVAIKKFLTTGDNATPTTAAELLDFKKSMPASEWRQMGKDACEALDEKYEE